MSTTYEGWQDGEVLEELDERGQNLTPWEIHFVEEMTKILKSGGELSEDQSAKIRQIAEDRVP